MLRLVKLEKMSIYWLKDREVKHIFRTKNGTAEANKQFVPMRSNITLQRNIDQMAFVIPLCTCPLPEDQDELEFKIELGLKDNLEPHDVVTVHIYR